MYSGHLQEQAHTIDDLLQAKANGTYVSPSKTKSPPNCARIDSPTASESFTGPADNFASPEHANLIASLHQECEVLQEEVARLKSRFREERVSWQTGNEKKESELLREIKSLQLERQKLKKRLEEQALTIHELTLQEEEEEEEEGEGDGEQSCACGSEQVADNFDPGLSSCADSCASLRGWRDIDSQETPTRAYHNLPHQSGDEFWLPPRSRSSDHDRSLPSRQKSRSPFKVSTYGLHDP